MKVASLSVGPFQENCYLLVDEKAGRCVIVDPGGEPERIVELIRESGAEPDAVWLTHAHLDHVGGIAGLKRAWDVPVYLHPNAVSLYTRASVQAQFYGIPFEQPPPAERQLADGDTVRAGNLEFRVMHTPGHAPGHVVFVGEGVVLSGDLLFAGSIGRTDLPFSDANLMVQSLERIAALPAETVVYPGHGPVTSIGTERATNPFLTGLAHVAKR